MKKIVLKGLNTSFSGDILRVEAEISGIEPLWFELDKEYQHLVDTESVDAFFLLYTWLAMEVGCNLVVEGKVSERLSEALVGKVKDLFLVLCPNLKNIDICVNHTSKDWNQDDQCGATGFSGGVDSWYTALEAMKMNCPYSYYLFVNTGQHGKNNVEEVVSQRASVASNALNTVNKPLIVINSNVDSVFRERFQQRDVIGNIACVLLLQQGISSYSYSSSYAPEDSKIIEHYDMSIMDPFLLPALNTERVEFKSIGIGATRIEKLRYISHEKIFSKKIYVCIEKDLPIKNCGQCFKCRRTQLALDSLGEIELIRNNFDLNFFKRIRPASLIGLFASAKKDNLDLEVTDEIVKKYGLKVLHLRVAGSVWSTVRNYIPGGLKWRSMAKAPYLW